MVGRRRGCRRSGNKRTSSSRQSYFRVILGERGRRLVGVRAECVADVVVVIFGGGEIDAELDGVRSLDPGSVIGEFVARFAGSTRGR